MNILEALESSYKNVPYLDHNRAVLSAPVRHIFMISLLGYLKNLQIYQNQYYYRQHYI